MFSIRKKGNSDKWYKMVKDIMLSEISQPQKDTHYGPSEKEEQRLLVRGQREERGIVARQLQFCKMKRFWKLTSQ